MNVVRVKRLVELDVEIKRLETQVKELKSQKGELEQKVLDDMTEAGVQNLKVSGKTVYVKEQIWASPVKGRNDDLCNALISLGHDDVVKQRVSTQTLSALYREWDKINLPPPQELEDIVNVAKVHKVAMRKSS